MTPYRPPIKRFWFFSNLTYTCYIIRESMCLFTGLYTFNLLIGLIQLARGVQPWENWLHFQMHPMMVVFSIITLILTWYHAITFFLLTPRVMPQRLRQIVPDWCISFIHFFALLFVLFIALISVIKLCK